MELNLEEIRGQIDAIDRELVDAFCRRMDLAKKVAAYKIENDMPVLRPEREVFILDKVEAQAGEEYGGYVRDLYQHVLRESREMQQKMIDEHNRKSK
ncbi:MAG: chorismate mutase [Anaerovoracaceae bacterium]